jgi:hypothetical protein
MKFLSIGFAASLLIGSVAIAHAQLPAPTAEKKAPPAAKAKPAKKPSPGANHADSRAPDAELTRREAQNEMPKPGQANDHSTTARDPKNSSGRR